MWVSVVVAGCSAVFQDVWFAGGRWHAAGAPGLHKGPSVGEWGWEDPGGGLVSFMRLFLLLAWASLCSHA